MQMTVWHFFAGYSLAGVGYLILASLGKSIAAFVRPPSADGYLDVKLRFGTLSRWFIVSAVLISPVVVAYAGDLSADYRDALQRSNTMLLMYVAIAMVWIVKLQLQLNTLCDRIK